MLISPYFIHFSFKGNLSARAVPNISNVYLMAGEIAIDIKSFDVRKSRPTTVLNKPRRNLFCVQERVS